MTDSKPLKAIQGRNVRVKPEMMWVKVVPGYILRRVDDDQQVEVARVIEFEVPVDAFRSIEES